MSGEQAGELAVLVNPHAGGARAQGRRVERLRRVLGDRGRVYVPADLAELDRVVADLVAREVVEVAVVGGDGTVSRALTALVGASDEPGAVRIALLGGGTMNTVARSFGARGQPERALATLIDARDRGQPLPAPPHATLSLDGERVGMLVGTGLFARYIEDYDALGGGPVSAARVLARAVLSALVGGAYARRLTARTQATVQVDGAAPTDGRWLVAAAGVIPSVGLGFRPFARVRERPDRLAYLVIGCSPGALALRMVRAFRGRALRHPEVLEGTATQVVLRAQGVGPVMMDGDLGQTGPVTTLALGPRLGIVRFDFSSSRTPR